MTTFTFARRLLIALAMTGIALGLSCCIGQEVKAAKGRLPPYYSDIVTETQRQKIYLIQRKYAEALAELKTQIAKLEKQLDTEIEGLLDDDQKQRLKQAQEQAAAKRKKGAADKKAAADNAPPQPE